MQLSELINSIPDPLRISCDTETDITGLYYDSRMVKPGGLFFALKGVAVDGHRFVEAALKSGAAAIVLEDLSYAPPNASYIQVDDARLAMSMMAAAFCNDPTNGIPVIGITGTNGKTTTTYLIEAILRAAGIPAAVLGTIHYRFGDALFSAPHTTPESVELQKTLRELVDLGAKSVVMEVSSHALDQRRVDGCRFDIGIFTNLTRDHLDYHKDMDSYLASKKRFFTELLAADQIKTKRKAVVNTDDPAGRLIAASAACPVITYGLSADARVTARDVNFSTSGISGVLAIPGGESEFHSGLLGRFNLYNILAAAAAAVAMELPTEAIRAGIEGHDKVAGRLERVNNDRGITVLVDYAHTGDALENVLKTLREIARKRIITVFGCGGDRDRGKRPVMGEIAGRYSDICIITSDNPRSEDPASIIKEVKAGIVPLGLKEYAETELDRGFSGNGFATVESRREAIRLAIRLAKIGDIVLLAGKGHEDYQIIGGERHHFDDREEAAAALRENPTE
jgi:UDP-N-acetylmuramoyl-L-alanyl-D-glutamate--2,6-diaminopimelate ligase